MQKTITLVLGSLALALSACEQVAEGPRFKLVIGSRGLTMGKFNRPRGIACNDASGVLYVVDWSGRVQIFSRDGGVRGGWMMPKVEKGKPEGLCLNLNGNILVTDTHYSRIVEFTPQGKLLRAFGSYGQEPGQFIYPVAICVDPAGAIYVSEYGENDRVQKFDAEGNFIRAWGSFGIEPGQFQRPSGLALNGDELFVADAVNHRLQVFSLDGELRRVIGRQGRAPGEFTYPYDVSIQDDAVYVVEFGNRRVQKLTLAGEPLAQMGSGGNNDGCFADPWKLTAGASGVFVSDTYNHRVVKIDL